MKPRNKTERRVWDLSLTLPILSIKDKEWINNNYKREYKGKGLSYYLVLQRCKEFQVIRYFYKTSKSFFEFCQVWCNKDSKVVMAKNRFMGVDNWVRDSDITIKDWFKYGREYTYLGGIDRLGWSGCLVKSLLPELRQRGIKTSTHGLHPVKLCFALLQSNRLETLFKLKQYALVHFFMQTYRKLDDTMWQAIRVALRHGYHWDDEDEVQLWRDFINDLSYLGLDTRNPHYICPSNLMDAHNHYNERRRRLQDMEQLQQEMEKIKAYEPTFRENREQFFGMMFAKGHVTIQIIPTALAIKEEGIAMHHCVGGYYNRLNSLILSAKVDGKRMETIEIDLTDYRIVQSRGLQNKQTSYHNQIVHLMKQGLPEIRKRNEEHKLKIAV